MPSTAAPSPAQIARAVTAIRWYLSTGMPVAVHNGAGPGPAGHAGTVVAGYLVAEGASAEDAAAAVQRAWPGAVEGVSQVAALSAYAMHCARRSPRAMRGRPTALPGPGRKPGPPPASRTPRRSRPGRGPARLLDGNRRFAPTAWCTPASGPPGATSWRRRAPLRRHAGLLGLASRRVVFDQGLGDLFVVRSAGPVLDSAVVGLLELAVEEAGRAPPAGPRPRALSRRRRAVAGPAGTLPRPRAGVSITQAIAPAVEEAAARRPAGEHPAGPRALVVDLLRRMQPVLAPAVEGWRLRVVGARYDLEEAGWWRSSSLTSPSRTAPSVPVCGAWGGRWWGGAEAGW